MHQVSISASLGWGLLGRSFRDGRVVGATGRMGSDGKELVVVVGAGVGETRDVGGDGKRDVGGPDGDVEGEGGSRDRSSRILWR